MNGRLTLPIGITIGESYRIERAIGSGGFGITYLADDIHLGTKVAIKEYCPEEFGVRDERLRVGPKSERQKETFEWGLRSFLQEARTLARFKHPSIVRVTRVFEAYSTAYMVMEFEEGRNFDSWLRTLGRPPTQEELDRIAAPLLDALELMHAQSFLHRDIAPDNVLIRSDGTPLLLDFGAARRAVAEKSRTLTGIIKMGYSPFEQYAADSRLQGPWTDIYALGATLYRAIAGRPPEEATLRMADDRMISASKATTAIYRRGFLQAIDACLRPRHGERPQSVAQLRPLLLEQRPPLPDLTETPKTVRLGPTKSHNRASSFRSSKTPRLAVAGVLVLVGGVLAGLQYTRWASGDSSIQLRQRTRDPEQPRMAPQPAAVPPQAIPRRLITYRNARFSIQDGTEFFGESLQKWSESSTENCAQTCERQPECTAFTHATGQQVCNLFKTVRSKALGDAFISGVRSSQK